MAIIAVLLIYTFLVGKLREGKKTQCLYYCSDAFFSRHFCLKEESEVHSFPVISLKSSLKN